MNRSFLPIALVLLLGCSYSSFAQSSAIPLSERTYEILDRFDLMQGDRSNLHFNIKPYRRRKIMEAILSSDSLIRAQLPATDLRYLYHDNNAWLALPELPLTVGGKKEAVNSHDSLSIAQASALSPLHAESQKPLWKYFYRTPANMLEANSRYFFFRANPLYELNYGPIPGQDQPSYTFRRGFEVLGAIDDRVEFFLAITLNEFQTAHYIRERVAETRVLPYYGNIKKLNRELFGIENGYNILDSRGYLAFQVSPHVGLEFGFGKHFLGDGYRSLFLSDFSFSYPYLKLDINVWKLHFLSITGELQKGEYAGSWESVGPDIRKKYFSTHYLSVKLTPSLRVGVFESVVFARNEQFEFHYLNPLILYRAVEHSLGSPDNVLLGLDAAFTPGKNTQFYAQFVLDEFKFRELISGDKWWANKFGLQAGIKQADLLGIDNLFVQLEYNSVRPYTYSQTLYDRPNEVSHFGNPLSHPLGANFREVIFRMRYPISPRLKIDTRLIYYNQGEDDEDSNWGGNIFKSALSESKQLAVENEYGNFIGQGIGADVWLAGVDLSYELAHNVYLDLGYFRRSKNSEDDARDQSVSFFSGGMRVNLNRVRFDF